ncbi:MAG: hypothetical protein ACPG77_17155, partial [Nannocystaceae bacterium]
QATQLAEQQARQRAQAELQRIAHEQAEQAAAELAIREARAREERLRLQEVALRAGAEQERILVQERMRLDAKMKLETKKARPVYLYGLIGVLVLAAGGMTSYGYEQLQQQENAHQLAQAEEEAREAIREQELAALRDELGKLSAEQTRLEEAKAALDRKVKAVKDGAQRQRLLAEKAQLDAEIAANKSKQKRNRKRRTTRPKDPKPANSGIEINHNPEDPLDGIG